MNMISNRTFAEIKIGDSAHLEHILTETDLALFAAMSGDINPIDTDEIFTQDRNFHQIIGHSMWGASFISTLLSSKLPGPGMVYVKQTLNFLHPIMLGDKIIATVTVKSKEAKNHEVTLECICLNQNGATAISGTAVVIAPTVKMQREAALLPRVKISDPSHDWYTNLKGHAQKYSPLITAIVHPVDELSLGGAIEAALDKIITPILVGPKERILALAQQMRVDIADYQIIDAKHSLESVEVAVNLAKTLQVEALMKGKLHTDELMGAVVHKDSGIRTSRRMSHVFVIAADNYPKPLFLTDAAINLFPNLLEKVDIVQNAIDLFRGLGLGIPRIAIVSAIETVNPNIPSTLDATALCKMAERGQIVGAIIDGPLAFDNAISCESAKVKGIVSPVAGNADIIVVPDIESGNLLYKQMTYLSKMEAAGIVMGAKVPIILTSRGSDQMSRKASAMLAQLYFRNKYNLDLVKHGAQVEMENHC